MRKLLIFAISLLVFGCNKSEENPSADKTDFAGTWVLIHEEGYEVDGPGRRDEWNEKRYDETYTFNYDNTGLSIEIFEGEEDQMAIRWGYNATNKSLNIDYGDGDVIRFVVKSVSPTTLVLVHRIKEMTEHGAIRYEYYNESTYTKTKNGTH